MRRSARLLPLSSLLALAGAAALVAFAVLDGSGELLAALPAALLALLVASRHNPGEKLLVRLARAGRRPRRRARRLSRPRIPAAPTLGLLPLLASVRPLRGPPLLSSHSI